MRILAVILFGLLCLCCAVSAQAIEKIFYLTSDTTNLQVIGNNTLTEINAHARSIDILAPQIYVLDAQGIITGVIDPKLLSVAAANKIKIMPLVVNKNFDQKLLSDFLHHPDAQRRAIDELLVLGKKYHFYGFQLDFENISINDRDAFTRFFTSVAAALHRKGYIISAAVVPRTGDIYSTRYDQWVFENWSGGYDYQKLARAADFLTIMSYDCHTSLTTPGPIAPVDWVEKTIQNIIKVVPPEKISLGIPVYSGYWFTGQLQNDNMPEKFSYRSKELQISYASAARLFEKFKPALTWSNQWQSFYTLFTDDDKTNYLFVEDARSFQAKLALASRYHLRGISVWKLGLEDPKIWNLTALH